MNGIYGMELQYESLIPIEHSKDVCLSVGTVTFLMEGKELPLDFKITESSMEETKGFIISINACIKDFDPKIFMNEYEELGVKATDLDYIFFAARHPNTYLLEVYTEFFYTHGMIHLPVSLKSARLLFQDGNFLDYSDHITMSAQNQLAEVL